MPANYADKPTSEWEHSHALAEGDELENSIGTRFTVKEVQDNGDLIMSEYVEDGEDETQEWPEEQIVRALVHTDMEHTNGQSHELASF